MNLLWLFVVGFVCSYLGSIPPGVINVSVLQYGLHGHRSLGLRFGLAASLVEFVYAAATVRFHIFLTENTSFTEDFELVSGIVLTILGVASLLSSNKAPSEKAVEESPRAFRKGLIIGVTNIMVIPFWLAVTAYLQSRSIVIIKGYDLFIYVAGISAGTFALMASVAYLSNRFQKVVENRKTVNKIPGIVLLTMGLYSFYNWFMMP
ncbi:MAG: LysE family transporter [Imperialibacter sp.]